MVRLPISKQMKQLSNIKQATTITMILSKSLKLRPSRRVRPNIYTTGMITANLLFPKDKNHIQSKWIKKVVLSLLKLKWTLKLAGKKVGKEISLFDLLQTHKTVIQVYASFIQVH